MVQAVTSAAERSRGSHWDVDPSHTHVEFSGKHMMVSTVKGTFNHVSGTIDWNEAAPTESTVDVQIDATSLASRWPDRDTHLKSADFLNVERYPLITFRSKRVQGYHDGSNAFQLVGDLTIRDVTREVTLDVEYDGRQRSPWGEERAGFTARTQVDRRDFGLAWNVALETGGVLVGNTIKIAIEVEAIQRSPEA